MDGEAAECRLCKHCGCMCVTDQKQGVNFVWYKDVCVGRSLMNCAMKEEMEVSLFSGGRLFSKVVLYYSI